LGSKSTGTRSGWARLTAKLGGKVQLVGDEIFVTTVERLGRGIREKVANSIEVLFRVGSCGQLLSLLVDKPVS
jgi:enolase